MLKHGRWIYWEGWCSNHDMRIEDAVCSECGYKHPTVRWEQGDVRGIKAHEVILNKLADKCPKCGVLMKKGNIDKEKKQQISDLLYKELNYMYCDNCRFNSEISEEESEEKYGYWGCEDCHRKYNGWGISRAECDRLARIIGEI